MHATDHVARLDREVAPRRSARVVRAGKTGTSRIRGRMVRISGMGAIDRTPMTREYIATSRDFSPPDPSNC